MVIWDMEVRVQDLIFTAPILRRSSFREETVSLSKLVDWQSMQAAQSVAKGPGPSNMKFTIAWISVLKVLIEVCTNVSLYAFIKYI